MQGGYLQNKTTTLTEALIYSKQKDTEGLAAGGLVSKYFFSIFLTLIFRNLNKRMA